MLSPGWKQNDMRAGGKITLNRRQISVKIEDIAFYIWKSDERESTRLYRCREALDAERGCGKAVGSAPGSCSTEAL